MSDTAIHVEGIGKSYRIAHAARSSYKTLQEDLIALLKRPFDRNPAASGRRETFWALKDISFDVKQGEVLGIIGRNGAGKSTLLKILSRITKPTTGYADVYGRVGSLLEVGTGFHPELTGRENIFLNGAILGMTRREIQRRFDEIVDFAEVEQFLDTPVKRYSSGMYMRLAFAVAAHLEPEILVVDEVLAVGDAKFQEKSLGKMSEVARGGRTVLFVSHNMSAVVALCTTGLLLEKGEIAFLGSVSQAVSQYLKNGAVQAEYFRDPKHEKSKLTLDHVCLKKNDVVSTHFNNSETLVVQIDCTAHQRIAEAQVAFEFSMLMDECLFSSTSQDVTAQKETLEAGQYRFECPIPLIIFRPGQYTIMVSSSVPNYEYLDAIDEPLIFEIFDDSSPASKLGQSRRGKVMPILNWHVEKIS